jgi:hypothetical protein
MHMATPSPLGDPMKRSPHVRALAFSVLGGAVPAAPLLIKYGFLPTRMFGPYFGAHAQALYWTAQSS